jgi:hypothetical protein
LRNWLLPADASSLSITFNGLFACRLCSAALEEAASQQLAQLFGPGSQAPGFQYVAAHLRLGGLGHEGRLKKDRGTGKGELADVIGGLSCAQKLGQGVGLNTNEVPVLLITDNHMLRSFVLSGGLVSLACKPLQRLPAGNGVQPVRNGSYPGVGTQLVSHSLDCLQTCHMYGGFTPWPTVTPKLFSDQLSHNDWQSAQALEALGRLLLTGIVRLC